MASNDDLKPYLRLPEELGDGANRYVYPLKQNSALTLGEMIEQWCRDETTVMNRSDLPGVTLTIGVCLMTDDEFNALPEE